MLHVNFEKGDVTSTKLSDIRIKRFTHKGSSGRPQNGGVGT